MHAIASAVRYAEFAQRKMFLALSHIKEPKRLETAIGSLWSAYMAVLATLSLQFAQIVALALGLAETIKPSFARVLSGLLELAIDPKLWKWIPTIINSTLNLLVVYIAWKVAEILASVYSGLRGGRMFAIALMGFIIDMDLINWIPLIPETVRENIASWFEEEKDEEGNVTGYNGYLDEVLGYTLAAVGVYSQISSGFNIAFPLNLVFMPLTIVEWFLRYQIASTAAG